jgi:hypothetical protein
MAAVQVQIGEFRVLSLSSQLFGGYRDYLLVNIKA